MTLKLFCAVAVLFISSWAWGQTAIVIKFSHVVAETTPKGKGALKFKELAEARSNGRVRVEVYPNGTLYKDKNELGALLAGDVHMLAPSTSMFPTIGGQEFELFDLPYLFDNALEFHRVMDTPIGTRIMANIPKGLFGLAFWDNGFKQLTANKPLRKVEDFKDLRIRVQPSRTIDAQMKALGSIPTVLDFSEVYLAMKSGIVDGTEATASNIYTQHYDEVQKFITVSDHGYQGYVVITTKKFWDTLPSDIREVLQLAMRDATVYTNERAEADNQEALRKLAEGGKVQIIKLTPDERSELRKTMMRAHRDAAIRIGEHLVRAIYKASGFVKQE